MRRKKALQYGLQSIISSALAAYINDSHVTLGHIATTTACCGAVAAGDVEPGNVSISEHINRNNYRETMCQ